MSEELVQLTVDHGIARITLNRPDQGNVIDLSMARALLAASVRCDGDASIRSVLLSAKGRMFCAGGDISAFVSAGDDAPMMLSELAGTFHMAVSRLARMRKPMVALVQGPAAGAGFGLALLADVVLASRTAHFTPAYSAIGLTPDGGLTWQLPRLVGMRKAQEIILSNRRVPAEEAEAIGIVTRLVEQDDLAAEGEAVATAFASAATMAVGATRALLVDSFTHELETQLELEARQIAEAGGRPEFREGIAAFMGKRKPDFRGA